jgi:hypothetical protein
MTKLVARKIIHRYARGCSIQGMTQSEWECLGLEEVPEEVREAYNLVPESWEHFGYWVWQPIRR